MPKRKLRRLDRQQFEEQFLVRMGGLLPTPFHRSRSRMLHHEKIRFTGALNAYHNMERTWELKAAWTGMQVWTLQPCHRG